MATMNGERLKGYKNTLIYDPLSLKMPEIWHK
jgi:hypothetical protein